MTGKFVFLTPAPWLDDDDEIKELKTSLRELVARIDETFDPALAGNLPIRKLLEPELTGARAALARSEGKQ